MKTPKFLNISDLTCRETIKLARIILQFLRIWLLHHLQKNLNEIPNEKLYEMSDVCRQSWQKKKNHFWNLPLHSQLVIWIALEHLKDLSNLCANFMLTILAQVDWDPSLTAATVLPQVSQWLCKSFSRSLEHFFLTGGHFWSKLQLSSVKAVQWMSSETIWPALRLLSVCCTTFKNRRTMLRIKRLLSLKIGNNLSFITRFWGLVLIFEYK